MKTAGRWLSVLLAVILIALYMGAYADEEDDALRLTVSNSEISYNLDVIKNAETWYADINQLAHMAGCECFVSQDTGLATMYIADSAVVLYSQKLEACVFQYDICYVPLKEASEAVGIFFYNTNPIQFVVYRTPKQMIAEFDGMFGTRGFRVFDIVADDFYWISESASRIYDVMPFVGEGSILGLISGADEEERYRNAFTEILRVDSSNMELFSAIASLNKQVYFCAKTIKTTKKISEKGGKLYDYLSSKGVSADILDKLAYEKDPYDMWEGFFEGWADIITTISFETFMDICAYYSLAMDSEESIITAMQHVFETTDNHQSRKAVEKLVEKRYGNDIVFFADGYGDTIWNSTTNLINDNIEEWLYGDDAAALGLAAKALDWSMQSSSKANAIIYFPIYASIQEDLHGYYLQHKNDVNPEIMYDLRATAIMYIKAAIAATKLYEFDMDLYGTQKTAFSRLYDALANVLSYTEEEYLHAYYNDELLCKLDMLANTSANERNEALSIPDDAVEYNGHWYKIYNNYDIASWDAASQFCLEQNGYLATITSAEENSFLYSYMTQGKHESAYFGLSDVELEGEWKFHNGEDVTYTNWHNGEPNGGVYENYCMFYYKFPDGSWNDGDFGNWTVNGGTAFICEWGEPLRSVEVATFSEESQHNPNIQTSILKVGDHLYFGSAVSDDMPDIWQVINVDGDFALVFNTSMYSGAFDATMHAITNAVSLTRYITYASATWEYSDVRSWLNSRDETVSYKDIRFDYGASGIASLVWDFEQGQLFENQAGYLKRFTECEYSIIQPVTHLCLIPYTESGQSCVFDTEIGDFSKDISIFYQDPYGISETTDYIFLLNGWEFKEYVLKHNLWGYHNPAGNNYALFWLRDSVAVDFLGYYSYYGSAILTIGNSRPNSTQADTIAKIRPACYIDMRYINDVTGTGKYESPYTLMIDSNVFMREQVDFAVSVSSATK